MKQNMQILFRFQQQRLETNREKVFSAIFHNKYSKWNAKENNFMTNSTVWQRFLKDL